MPSSKEHFEKAQSNLCFLESFALKKANDWAITIMFYTSLHLVEALIFQEVNRLKRDEDNWDYEIHSRNHDHRERQLKSLFNEIHFQYSELSKSADDGRYKIHRFRTEEVVFHYNNYFKPIVKFFNEYFANTELKYSIVLKDLAQ
jgi:hypothetical protein